MAKYFLTRRRPGFEFLSRAFCLSLDVSKGHANRIEELFPVLEGLQADLHRSIGRSKADSMTSVSCPISSRAKAQYANHLSSRASVSLLDSFHSLT